MNGVAYHPYQYSNSIPETIYEWQWLEYGSWIVAIDTKTKLPKWETEWGVNTTATFNNTDQADFYCLSCKRLAWAWSIPSFTNSWTTARSITEWTLPAPR